MSRQLISHPRAAATEARYTGGITIDAATKLVKMDNVAAIVGGLLSDSTMAAAHGVTVPKGVLLISPASTMALTTTLEDTIERTAIARIDSEG